MGFRARILAAFFILGILPLCVTGATGYIVSARLIEAVATARARAEVERHARMLDRARDLDRDLEREIAWSDDAAAGGSPTRGVLRGAAVPGGDRPLIRTFLVDTRLGRVSPMSGGASVMDVERRLALDGARRGTNEERVVSVGDARWMVARADLSDARWSVVGVSALSRLTGLWSPVRVAYLALLAVVLLCTLAALTYLVRPVVRTLEDLTDAARLIGDGEMAPWLPARSEGEVGRLSLATGAMVDRVERMMRSAEQGARMAMVGQLATYLTHEIRNPLSSIRLNLQSLARELRQGSIPSDVGEVTDLCLHEVERLDDVARSVLSVGRAPELRPAHTRVHELVGHAASVLRPELSRRSIALYLDMLADRDDVFADGEGLEGVFLNLFLNAVESVEEGGTIRASSGTRRDDQGRDWIWVEVADSGPGVPEQLRDRIFEPFFTTKPDGTGVGLATALETVITHGGSLSLVPVADPNAGAAFRVELPLFAVPDLNLPPPQGGPCRTGSSSSKMTRRTGRRWHDT